eukprot:TRINITY_DN848_c0_g1_i2.p1 TRINITY_DN848_c0_g1~~TRINITY_DN848_c0_g1_i2.p1  ORF type:complete len:108 (-),score=9.22 TRINITY_DN848_c0_g1_i2:163-486(-)
MIYMEHNGVERKAMQRAGARSAVQKQNCQGAFDRIGSTDVQCSWFGSLDDNSQICMLQGDHVLQLACTSTSPYPHQNQATMTQLRCAPVADIELLPAYMKCFATLPR